MSDTTITLRGRVGTDLSKTTTQNGRLTVRFRLAVTNWFATAEGVLTQGRTNWYTIRAWDRLATNLIHMTQNLPAYLKTVPTALSTRLATPISHAP